MKNLIISGIAAASLLASAALAAPAPWYKFQSKVNGDVVCVQTSPGNGWTRIAGPYKDSRCTKLGRP